MFKHLRKTKSGFTFIEIIICVIILMILWLAPLDIFFRNTYGASYSKHIAQASYAAKEVLETRRRYPFSNIVAQNITPTAAYPDISYTISLINYHSGDSYKRVQVEMSWKEKTFGSEKTMKQYFTTDISNEPLLN